MVQPHFQSVRAGVIRRVIRRGHHFICGICRTPHLQRLEAHSCLNRCWQEITTTSLVVKHRRGLSWTYRCRLCARDYDSTSAANQCALDCIDRWDHKYLRQKKLLAKHNLPEPPKRSFQHRPRLNPIAVQPVPTLNKKPRPTSPQDDGDNHNPISAEATADMDPSSPSEITASTPASDASENERETQKKHKSKIKPAEKFYRDNAKYACTVCNKRFFTKIEVEQCYDSHD